MSEEKEFLLMLIDKELEEEYRTTDDKEWLTNLINAKKWLLNLNRPKGITKLVNEANIQDDIAKYLGE